MILNFHLAINCSCRVDQHLKSTVEKTIGISKKAYYRVHTAHAQRTTMMKFSATKKILGVGIIAAVCICLSSTRPSSALISPRHVTTKIFRARRRQFHFHPPSMINNRPFRTSGIGNSLPFPVRVTIMGGGNFGLALASVLGRKGVPTTLLVRSADVASQLNTSHRHPRYMSDIDLPQSVVATSDPASALSDATYVVHAVPVQFSRDFLANVRDHLPPNAPVVSASKGIETSSLGFMKDILEECLGTDRSYAFLSGPSFAREICEGVATAVVIASDDTELAEDLADLMSSDTFRAFTSKDVVGIEVGGAVKNVIALAAGMCEGLGLGTNAMSGLVTRGCGEMRRLGIALGARPSTIAGLSGEGIV
mmetsp:Transcript_24477/g.55895  ORF Transcript_24477/g.55895 Transcript_24477/m.55895 type:complete len:365 (-) Transcript_24477:551-1645(-)